MNKIFPKKKFKIPISEPRKLDKKLNEHYTGDTCPKCGGRMISCSVAWYCEEAFYNPKSNCDNMIMSG